MGSLPHEFALIRALGRVATKADASLVLTVGDDCAAWKPAHGKLQIATTDTLVEGVHFLRSDAEPRLIGRKAMGANLSDIAAMGGTPRYALVALSIPMKGWSGRDVLGIYEGLLAAGSPQGVRIAGGNITRSSGKLEITITLTGEVKPGAMLKRSGARVGDSIYVTGVPGRAAMWLDLKRRKAGSRAVRELFRLAHYQPEPPLEFARRLSGEAGGKKAATAAVDISDGLLADLGHLIELSGVPGAIMEADKLPSSVAHLLYRQAAGPSGTSRLLRIALTGGEDYELLFTAPPSNDSRVRALAAETGVRVSRIGRITHSSGIRVVDGKGRKLPVGGHGGWRHF
ncbi:MAG: thiamine-phosphate kinase [Deltaproteobacteria bacterium]|nr:thiamine-phosphate kinase [Deltaproteobacteria bacterium]